MPRAKKPKPAPESPRLPRSFDRAALEQRLSTWARPSGLGQWNYDSIVGAREAQSLGKFRHAAHLGRAMLSDPAIFAAALQRLAPHRGLPREIAPPKECTELKGNSTVALAEAQALFVPDTSVCLPPGVLSDTFAELAIHELSVAQVWWETRPDGSRLDPFVSSFDLEAVEWQEWDRKLYAWTREEGRVEIVHGDGRWIVTQRSSARPWTRAALLPLALLWLDNAFGRRDRGANAQSHGDDKWLGELPGGVAIDSEDGVAMLDQMLSLYDTRRVMLRPAGAKVERSEAMSQNWQIFKELLESNDKSAHMILLGQDAAAQASSQRLTVAQLFGVRNDIVESDVSTVGSCLATGLLRPWSLINFGRWDRLSMRWLMPDADEDARRESISTRTTAFHAAVKAAKDNGFLVDQDYVDELARDYGIKAPRLAPVASNAPPAAAPVPAPSPASIRTPRQPLTAA